MIANARSGGGHAADIGVHLSEALRRRHHEVQRRLVADIRRVRTQLVQAACGVTCVVGIGGDETLSELARVAQAAHVPLLPVPAGFGNIFAAAFGWRATVPAVLEAVERGRVQTVDAGVCGDSLFLSSQGFGFLEVAKLAVEMSELQPRQRWRRYGSYVHAALQSIVRTPLPTLGVEVDGRALTDRASMAIVANVPTYRTFLPIVTDATPFDGLLDVAVSPARSKSGLVAWLLGTLVRAPGARRNALARRASRVTISDGAMTTELRVVPRSVAVLLPGDGGRRRRPTRRVR
jgi:diacylglycerol kinase (ATP)